MFVCHADALVMDLGDLFLEKEPSLSEARSVTVLCMYGLNGLNLEI